MTVTYWFIFFSFVSFAVGSIAAVRGSAVVARKIGLSPQAIGLVVVAAATSTPELFVMLRATAAGKPDLALGAIIGSSILTLTFMLGFGALIRPLSSPPKVVLRDGGVLLLACLTYMFFAHNEVLARRDGAMMLLLFALYVALACYTDWRRSAEHSVARARANALENSRLNFFGAVFVMVLGLVAVMLGAHLAVAGSLALARGYGLPEYAAGLTVVALAVSLPELFVILGGVFRGRINIAVGQVITASIFNLTVVLGLAAVIAPLAVSRAFLFADNLILLGICAVLPLILAMRWRLSRPRGLFLVLCYGGYLTFLAIRLNLLTVPLQKFW
jgi:cation:H+ antiporter